MSATGWHVAEGNKGHKGSKEFALVLLLRHPEWSNTRIAAEAGCSRETLSRWETFRRLRALLKQPERLRRGHQTADGVEAVSQGEEE